MRIHRSARALPAGLLLTLLAAVAQAEEPALVRDLRPGGGHEQGRVDFFLGTARTESGILFFAASDPIHGMEPWRTDGTPEGTFRLADVCPGRCSSMQDYRAIFQVFAGEVYFSADDGVSGRELWASGDTPGTVRRVRDLCPGPCSSSPRQLTAVGDRMFFEAGRGGGLRALWTSDGSRQGTTLVRDLCQELNEYSIDCIFGGIVEVGGRAVFSMNDGTSGVWSSDGTREGTGPYTDVVGEFSSFAYFVPTGTGSAFAWSFDGLWFTDGTAAGTRRLKTVEELGITDPYFVFSVYSTVWKGMLVASLEGTHLVRSDGTSEGTVRFAEIPSSVAGFAPLEDSLLLVLRNAVWQTGGTAETTGPVGELAGGYVASVEPVAAGVAVCMQNESDYTKTQLWWSDGTAAGTHRATADIGCGYLASLTPGRVAAAALNRLWSTDGTPAGTSELYEFRNVPAGSGPLEQLAWRGKVLFTARTSEQGTPLFFSDGTSAGTHQVGRQLDGASELVRAGDRVFFEGAELIDDGTGYIYPRSIGLWATDGSAAGTVPVDPNIGSYNSPMPVGRSLFFSAARIYSHYGDPDLELFRSNGTAAGTGLVKNVNNFSADTGFHHICYNAPSRPGPGIALGGRLLFVADDGLHGRELWVSTGTRTGTHLLRDIDPRRLPEPPPGQCDDRRKRTGLGSEPRDFVLFGNGVLFTATDGEAGRELWWTDGSGAGTRRVADLRPGAQGSEPHDLVVFRGRVWFVASTEGAGEDLWQSDGTPQGTVRVRRLAEGAFPSWAHSLTVAGNRLFFVLSGEVAGPELWVSGGTAESIHRVADLRPGPEGSYPQALTAVGKLLVFAADDGVHGLEAWRSDGTAAGTVLLGDVHPGRDASAPGPFTPLAGGRVLSGADDGEHGREPWVY